jgi:hypothetical protein
MPTSVLPMITTRGCRSRAALRPVAAPAEISPDSTLFLSVLNPSGPNCSKPPEAHNLDTAKAGALQALSDSDINAAVRENTDDAFWEQYDAVRRRAIASLIRSHPSPT